MNTQAASQDAQNKRVVFTRNVLGDIDVHGAATSFWDGRDGIESLLDVLRGEDGTGCDAVVSWVSERVDASYLEACGAVRGGGGRLKLIANYAVGFDNVDLDSCRDFGVRVSNTPDAVTEGTAELACMLLLAAARKVIWQDRYARSGDWAASGVVGPAERITMPIGDRNLLIVGGGRIGHATAQRMLGFGMHIGYVARTPKPAFEAPPLNATHFSLEQGLRWADFISVHAPLTPETKHLIGRREFELMKESAIFVNTARGAVTDEDALASALESGQIYAAGLDVFEREPIVLERLKQLQSVVMTPHIGSGTTSSREMMTDLVCQNIRAVFAGNEPVTPVL